MKLTEVQVKAFQGLQKTETGRVLADILRGVINDLCDVRNMSEVTEADRKAIVRLSKLIEEEVITRLVLTNEARSGAGYE